MLNRTIACAMMLSLLTIGGACSDDEPQAPESEMISDDDRDDDVDESVDEKPREDPDVNVGPIPRFLVINIEPGRVVYPTGLAVLPVVDVYDLEGEEAPTLLHDVSVQPPGSAELNDAGRWVLLEEGTISFEACAQKLGPDDEPVCATDTIVVDDSSPTIEVDSPLPGAELDADSNPTIVVEGRVTDSHGEPVLFVNGQIVALEDGEFSTEVTPRPGINHIALAASDGINPETTNFGLDVMWAHDYREDSPVQNPDAPGLFLEDGIVLRLGQNFVDDGVSTRLGPDGSVQTRDLADILELVVVNIDFASQISNPVVSTGGFELSVLSVDVGKPTIIADITDDGIDMYIQMRDLIVTTSGGLEVEGQSLDLDGDVVATFSALASIEIDKASPGAPVEAQVDEVLLAVEDADANFASPEANAIFELAQSALRTTLEDLILDSIEGAFVDELPGLIADLFDGLDAALSDQSIDLDIGFGEPLALGLDAGIANLETVYRNRLLAGLDVDLWVEGQSLWEDSRGVALLEPASMSTPFFDQGRVQLALSTTLVNGLFHTLWDGGLLELDVTDEVPVNLDSALVSAKLPPVLRPPLEGQDADVVLQIGQLELDIVLGDIRETHAVNIEAGITIDLDSGQLSVEFDDDPRIRTWLIETSEDAPLLTQALLESLLRTEIYTALQDALSDGLALPLPIPELGGLSAIAPALTDFELTVSSASPLASREGYLVLDLDLIGSLP